MPGLINLDFADVRTVMQDGGNALMGIGFATGENRAREAAERALRSPLIDTELAGARGILLSIAGGEDLSLFEVNEAAEVVRQGAIDDTNLIFGATIDDRLHGPGLGDGGRHGPRRGAPAAVRSPSTRATRPTAAATSSRRASCATCNFRPRGAADAGPGSCSADGRQRDPAQGGTGGEAEDRARAVDLGNGE